MLVEAVRDADDDALPEGVRSYVAGPAGATADFVEAFGEIDGILLGVALSAVLVILLLVYRSPVLPFLVIFSSVFALAAASVVVYCLAREGVVDLNGQSQGILFILVVGAATDYALLLVARYREELRRHDDRYLAMRMAWRRALEPIVASGTTVILGLLCLLLSDLGSNRGLGPVASVGIVAAMLSALTFLPAALLLPGPLVALLALGVGAGRAGRCGRRCSAPTARSWSAVAVLGGLLARGRVGPRRAAPARASAAGAGPRVLPWDRAGGCSGRPSRTWAAAARRRPGPGDGCRPPSAGGRGGSGWPRSSDSGRWRPSCRCWTPTGWPSPTCSSSRSSPSPAARSSPSTSRPGPTRRRSSWPRRTPPRRCSRWCGPPTASPRPT